MPDEPEPAGLLALMLLIDSRRAARTGPERDLILLSEQDRTRWDGDRIAEGQAIVRACLRRDQAGPYQIQAAINAVHSEAVSVAETDWEQIVQLYDQLMAFTPTPIVALHRAVAIAETEGPDAALDLVDRLRLDGYHLFHAVRADLLRRSGRLDEAARVYRNALELTENPAERRLLQRRRDELR